MTGAMSGGMSEGMQGALTNVMTGALNSALNNAITEGAPSTPDAPPSPAEGLGLLQRIDAAAAAQIDPVGWHYMEVLAERTRTQTGPAQALLQTKLNKALAHMQVRVKAHLQGHLEGHLEVHLQAHKHLHQQHHEQNGEQHKERSTGRLTSRTPPPPSRSPSPLSTLLQHMAAPSAERPLGDSGIGRMDKPRIVQFRQQLQRISVQKQVTQAIAQAPANAGPINSHMLVLRSLGLMRDISPDYLNRFMGYVDTLLVLEAAGQRKTTVKKSHAGPKPTS